MSGVRRPRSGLACSRSGGDGRVHPARLRDAGVLPGGLKVRRRAADLYQRLIRERCRLMKSIRCRHGLGDAVGAGGQRGERLRRAGRDCADQRCGRHHSRGAALRGDDSCPAPTTTRIVDFLLVAGALGAIYQQTASISGAEVGCQGEVGTACSMAAGALAEMLGGTPEQVENAAEIGMEHHLGLTCDPVGGLVQIPCIERNAVGSVKAITAARLALHGDGRHTVSLDKVIKTMMQTGADMKIKYKETARGGLAVNIVEC